MRFFILLLGFIFSISQVFAQSWEVLRMDNKQTKFIDVCENELQDYYISGTIEQYEHEQPLFSNSTDLLLLRVSAQGDTLSKVYSRMGYSYLKPFTIYSDNHEIIVIYVLSPCKDPLSPNYSPDFLNSDTIFHKLGFAKVDDHLNLYQIKEITLPTNDDHYQFIYKPILKRGSNFSFMIMEINNTPSGLIPYSNLTFFTIDDTGEIQTMKTYPISQNNQTPEGHLGGIIYNLCYNADYSGFWLVTIHTTPKIQFMNLDFDIIHETPIYDMYLFQGIQPEDIPHYFYPNTIIPSPKNASFYLSAGVSLGFTPSNYRYCLSVQEIDTSGYFAHHFQSPAVLGERKQPASVRALDMNDHHLFFAGALYDNNNDWSHTPTYTILYHLDENLELQNEYYYHYNEDAHLLLETIHACQDGGCLLLGSIYDWNGLHQEPHYDPFVVKYSPEAFTSIDEAHKSKLSMAIAYPNPGNDQLFIRTTVPNAYVDICDISGKLMTSQNIHTIETKFDVNNWNSGVYIWRVFSNGNVVETGKWLKE